MSKKKTLIYIITIIILIIILGVLWYLIIINNNNSNNNNQMNNPNTTYSASKEITSNEDITSGEYSSTNSDENAILVSKAKCTLSSITVTKTGDSDGGDNTSFMVQTLLY